MAVGDEILSIGADKVPKDCTEDILSQIIRRQDKFPPPICVISKVKFIQLDVGADEEIGIDVIESYDSDWAKVRGLPSIRIKSVIRYSPAYRARLCSDDRLTHIAGISVTALERD